MCWKSLKLQAYFSGQMRVYWVVYVNGLGINHLIFIIKYIETEQTVYYICILKGV